MDVRYLIPFFKVEVVAFLRIHKSETFCLPWRSDGLWGKRQFAEKCLLLNCYLTLCPSWRQSFWIFHSRYWEGFNVIPRLHCLHCPAADAQCYNSIFFSKRDSWCAIKRDQCFISSVRKAYFYCVLDFPCIIFVGAKHWRYTERVKEVRLTISRYSAGLFLS